MHSLDYRWTLTRDSFLALCLITRFLCEFRLYFIWFRIILSDLLWLLLLYFHFISFYFIVRYNLIMQEVQLSIRHSKEQSQRISQAKSILQLWRGLLNSSPRGISFDNYWIWKGKQHCNILYFIEEISSTRRIVHTNIEGVTSSSFFSLMVSRCSWVPAK